MIIKINKLDIEKIYFAIIKAIMGWIIFFKQVKIIDGNMSLLILNLDNVNPKGENY